ncbi:hypothetical protein J41TS12_00800 [Paenibacillus antibioticophila]|uniref:Uncharacterized protein n=1 Tax=Paenibacillus antibioticophila TaxID=1274374 RepID=A0A919XNW0_9BACL|nr:hypothetical protein J41TS12_00800 [Paenibacillus antibioticophila]
MQSISENSQFSSPESSIQLIDYNRTEKLRKKANFMENGRGLGILLVSMGDEGPVGARSLAKGESPARGGGTVRSGARGEVLCEQTP